MQKLNSLFSKKNFFKSEKNSINFLKIEEINKNINKNLISYPLFQNINNPVQKFYFTINKMYYNQLSNYFKHRLIGF